MIGLLAVLAVLAQDTVSYASEDAWLCRPGRQDACAVDLTTTVIAPDGRLTTEAWVADPMAPIDCFYIYPTVSRDTSEFSDMQAGAEERNVVRQQFARFASVCRPYAPVYRQVTLAALRARLASGISTGAIDHGRAYDDVATAWAHYLTHDNQGRGVVLIGHSQGAYLLQQLIRREIDGKPVQSRIVSALLLGGNLAVPRGRDVGGAFQSIPLCRRGDEIGCVISYVSFRKTVPPSPRALFGRVQGEGMIAACTNPAALGGGSAVLHAYFAGVPGPGPGAPPRHPWVTDSSAITTPFVSVPGLVSGQCVSDSLGTRLEITVHGDPADRRADDIPGDIGAPGAATRAVWGLHLADVDLAMGNLLDVVRRQSAAYSAARRR